MADEEETDLSLSLQMASHAVPGLPWFVEVTLSNQAPGTEYYDLLPCNPFTPPFPIELSFTDGVRTVVLPYRSASTEPSGRGSFDLLAGQARTFVVDISELEPALDPGAWQCQARWVMQHEEPRSGSVSLVLAAADPDDSTAVRRLRLAGGARYPSWLNFLASPDALAGEALQGVSEHASRLLVPYLIVHQIVHGPEPLATFPIDFFSQFQEGPWASEASVLSCELHWARRAPDLGRRRQDLLRRWPGLAYRVDQIEADKGLLTMLRRQYRQQEGKS